MLVPETNIQTYPHGMPNSTKKVSKTPLATSDSIKHTFEVELPEQDGNMIWQRKLAKLKGAVLCAVIVLSGVALLYTVFAPHSSNEKSPLHSCLFVYITQAICACLVEITLVLLFPEHMLLDRNWNVVRAFALVSALLPAMIFIGIPNYRPFDAHYHNVTFEANFGECKHVDIENMDPYIRDICGFHGYSKRHIFTSAAVMEKYDYSDAVLQDFHRLGTAGLAVFGEKMGGSEKILGLNVSFLDFSFCAVAHIPCSPDCVPQTVCPSAVKPMMRLLNNKYAKEMYDSDCKIINDYEDTVLVLSEKNDFFSDMMNGLKESCTNMLNYVYEGTPLQYASQPCYSVFNFTAAYGLKNQATSGKCTQTNWEALRREFYATQQDQIAKLYAWDVRIVIGVCFSSSLLIFAVLKSTIVAVKNTKQVSRHIIQIRKSTTLASSVCACIMFITGVIFLRLSSGRFAQLPDSLHYVYMLATIGVYAVRKGLLVMFTIEETVSVRLKKRSTSEVSNPWMVRILRLKRRFIQNFGISGRKFWLAAIVMEIFEITVQARAFFRNAAAEDVSLAISTCVVLILNCASAAIAHYYQNRGVLIAIDGTFDLLFTVIGSIRIYLRAKPIMFIDALALGFPLDINYHNITHLCTI